MVPSLTLASLAISAFITIALPIIVAVVIWRKAETKWWVFLVGMAGFIITQMIIRIPVMSMLSQVDWYNTFSQNTVPFYLFAAFTAGLFETAGRLLVFLVFIRMRRNYADGFLAGLGHGTIESILLVGSSMITYITYALMINAGTFETLVAPNATDAATLEAMNTIYNVLTTSASTDFLAAGLERLMAITLHIALSILVLEGIERKQTLRYALVALCYHMLVDFTVPLVYLKVGSIWVSELLMLLFTILPVLYIIKAKKRFVEIAAAKPVEAITEPS